MAAFKTHFCSSGILGFGYGLLGASIGLSGEHSLLAGALCTLGGMLPDLDSKSSVTARETFTFLSAVVSILVIKQLSETQTAAHYLILFGIVAFFVMRVGVVGLFQRCTVHRGMWHSVPAAMSAGLVVYLLSYGEGHAWAMFYAAGVVLSFVSHLLLDELASIKIGWFGVRFKKSFGTAFKFRSRQSSWANVSSYGQLALLLGIAVFQPDCIHQLRLAENPSANSITQDH